MDADPDFLPRSFRLAQLARSAPMRSSEPFQLKPPAAMPLAAKVEAERAAHEVSGAASTIVWVTFR
jgi:hypothetical protein